MELKNYMEDVVRQELKEYLENDSSFCRCGRCERDVMVLALNRLRGKYVGSAEGEIRAAVTAVERQTKADAMLALLDAVAAVRAHPHHKAAPAQEAW